MRVSTANSAAISVACGATWRRTCGRDLRVVDALLLLVAPQVRRADQLEAAAEARELGVLAERVEVELVRAADHHAVELHVLLR